MTGSPLDSFAAEYRLRVTRDAYGTRIIAGRVGSLITDYGDGRLTVLLTGHAGEMVGESPAGARRCGMPA